MIKLFTFSISLLLFFTSLHAQGPGVREFKVDAVERAKIEEKATLWAREYIERLFGRQRR